MKPITVVAGALVLSLLANAGQIYAYLAKRDQAVTHQVQERQAVGTALECSKGTEQLAGAAKARKAAAAPLIAAATDKARQLGREAQAIMARPAGQGADACTRAQQSVDAWAQERGTP